MRIRIIDFFRGIAILLVMAYHCAPLKDFFHWGWSGVDLFFVLSGFLVSGLLFEEYKKTQAINAFRFLVRRGLKVYPLFYVYTGTMLVVLFLNHILFDNPLNFTPGRILNELIFIQNYNPGLSIHTWSLAIEEHFYFLLVFTLIILTRFRTLDGQSIVAIYLFLFVVSFVGKWIVGQDATASPYQNLYPTHLRIDALFFGTLLSYLYHFHEDALRYQFQRNSLVIWILILLLLTPQVFIHSEYLIFYLPMLYIGYGLLIIKLFLTGNIDNRMRRILPFGLYEAICTLGFYSYSVYLWHIGIPQFCILFVNRFFSFELPAPIHVVVYAGISILLGIFMSKWLEQPVLKIRERYFGKAIATR